MTIEFDKDPLMICSPIIEDRTPIIEVHTPIIDDRSFSPLGHDELTLLALCGNYANGLWPVSGLSGQLSSLCSLNITLLVVKIPVVM